MNHRQHRIYSELIPDQNSRGLLAKCADELKPHVKARFVDPNTYHATLMHFGVPSQVFAELQTTNPELTQNQFERALDEYIQESTALLPKGISLQPESYSLLGARKNVLALSLEPTPEFQQAHIQSLNRLRSFLGQVAIDDTDRFMRTSQNFSWALGVKPHVTLARGVLDAQISSLNVPSVSLYFDSSRLSGI